MNKIYTIEITETLQKQVKIKANSQEEAEKKVKEQYQNNERNGKIIQKSFLFL